MPVQREVINQLKTRRFFSPDMKEELEPFNNHVVFIWDSFKLGFPSQKFFEHCPLLGEAFTVENNFIMRICPTFPIIKQARSEESNKFNATRVWGEAYVAGVHDMMRLDAIMDNLGSFRRRKRYIALADQHWPGGNTARNVTVQAWVYIATDNFWTEMENSLNIGSQTRRNGKLYWEWLHQNMRPTN